MKKLLFIALFYLVNPIHSFSQVKKVDFESITKMGELKFKLFSSDVIDGQEAFLKLIKNEFQNNRNIKKIDVVYHSNFLTILDWHKYLSLERANAVKNLLVKNFSLKGSIIETNIQLRKVDSNNMFNFMTNTIEIKIYYDNNVVKSEPKKEEKMQVTEVPKKLIKYYKVPMNLAEPDVVAVVVKNEKLEVVNRFTKEFKTRGKVEVEVPIDASMPGKYSISLVGMNRSMAKANVEIYKANN